MVRQSKRALRLAAEEKHNKLTFWICMASVVAIVAVVSFYLFGVERVKYDSLSGCPLVKGQATPTGHTVVLIDETDRLTENQKNYLSMQINALVKKNLQVGELLSIYSLDDKVTASSKPLFEMCKMRDGSDADKLSENERLINKRFKKYFQNPLEMHLKTILEKKEPAEQSPIFEMLRSISINSFMKWDVQGDRKLIVFSDMLHNTNRFSLYNQQQDFERFRKSAYAAEVSTQMPNVEVELNYFNNTPKYQKNRLTEFWMAYFRRASASVVSVQNIGK